MTHPSGLVQIENVVGSTGLDQELDLGALAQDLPGADYDPDRFPGLVYRTQEPKVASLLFRSGQIVTTGAQSEAAIHDALAHLFEQLAALGIEVPDEPAPIIQNMVSTADLGEPVSLNAVAVGLGLETIEDEPGSPVHLSTF